MIRPSPVLTMHMSSFTITPPSSIKLQGQHFQAKPLLFLRILVGLGLDGPFNDGERLGLAKWVGQYARVIFHHGIKLSQTSPISPPAILPRSPKIHVTTTSMTAASPLTMSQTKDELLRHLNMPSEAYTLMAKETDRIYKWLTEDPTHLKKNCKRQPPYDWSDIQEKAKDQAMKYIVESGDEYTSYYWNLAKPTSNCPNWIAKWFLYHKFRYRDGRNRNPAKSPSEGTSCHSTKNQSYQCVANAEYSHDDQYQGGSVTADSATQTFYPRAGTNSWENSYPTYDNMQTYTSDTGQQQNNDQESKTYYDPVRDI